MGGHLCFRSSSGGTNGIRVFSGEGHPGMEWNTSPSEAVVSVYFSFLGKINWPLFGDKKKTHCKNKKYQKIML